MVNLISIIILFIYNNSKQILLTKVQMNTTIRYWFPDTIKCKYMSFDSYNKALKIIELFKQIDVKSEVVIANQGI